VAGNSTNNGSLTEQIQKQ